MRLLFLFTVLAGLMGTARAEYSHINTHAMVKSSWYSDRSGHTASGMRPLYGVAHKTLPFGTKVRITYPKTGRSVIAVVHDRGPYISGRIIDVNQNVASFLGFSGVGNLQMEILN